MSSKTLHSRDKSRSLLSQLDPYFEIPYKLGGDSKEGCDCWGLVKLVYKEILGLDIPDYSKCYSSLEEAYRVIEEQRNNYRKIDGPSIFAIALFRKRTHCGVVASMKEIFHIDKQYGVQLTMIKKLKIESYHVISASKCGS